MTWRQGWPEALVCGSRPAMVAQGRDGAQGDRAAPFHGLAGREVQDVEVPAASFAAHDDPPLPRRRHRRLSCSIANSSRVTAGGTGAASWSHSTTSFGLQRALVLDACCQ